jgi:hypothetical protein
MGYDDESHRPYPRTVPGQTPSQSQSQLPSQSPSQSQGQPNPGWASGLVSAGSGALTYGVDGLKWAFSSTASVGSSLYGMGSYGLSKFKTQPKSKDE